eukprot:Selendium_serpulae@DN6283_c3_g7_i5.p2
MGAANSVNCYQRWGRRAPDGPLIKDFSFRSSGSTAAASGASMYATNAEAAKPEHKLPENGEAAAALAEEPKTQKRSSRRRPTALASQRTAGDASDTDGLGRDGPGNRGRHDGGARGEASQTIDVRGAAQDALQFDGSESDDRRRGRQPAVVRAEEGRERAPRRRRSHSDHESAPKQNERQGRGIDCEDCERRNGDAATDIHGRPRGARLGEVHEESPNFEADGVTDRRIGLPRRRGAAMFRRSWSSAVHTRPVLATMVTNEEWIVKIKVV